LLRNVRLTGRTALERARQAIAAHNAGDTDQGATMFEEPEEIETVAGLLVSRDPEAPTPSSAHLPALTALLKVSRELGAVLLGLPSRPDSAEPTPWELTARQSIADQLRSAASRVRMPAEVLERLTAASELLGVDVVPESTDASYAIDEVLVPGARICFTGTALDPDGRIVEREEMEDLATRAGLAPVRSVTKTRCEVLVIAEAGTQSGKARKAAEYDKPIFTADEFFGWLAGR